MPPSPTVALATVAREWIRIGVTGFGGPPAHIALLRRMCVDRREWLTDAEFEDGLAAANLLPGPASTQLAIFCAWRVRGWRGGLVGGACFIVPGLIAILALSALLLSGTASPIVLGVAAGAGAAVPAVAARAAAALVPPSWRRAVSGIRWTIYAAAGAVGAVLVGPWLVLVLLAAGVVEAMLAGWRPKAAPSSAAVVLPAAGTWLALVWTAVKVGALSYGGGFVIIPLMQPTRCNGIIG